ncbi:MAG: HEAT repeat domain-containing protein [Pirellulales bacterium]
MGVLREVPDPETLPQVRRMVDDDPEQELRLQAIRLLTELKDNKIVPSLLRLATDNKTSNPLRQAAINAVVDIYAKPYGQQLAEIALDESSPIPLVVTALDALAILRTEEAKQAIEKRLDDPRTPLRAKAIDAYTQAFGEEAAIRVLPKLQDPDLSVQRAALSALTVIFDAANVKIRFKVMQALAATPDQRALPIYLTALLDENENIRDVSHSTLAMLGDSICSDLQTLHDRNELAAPVRRELTKVFSANSNFTFLLEKSTMGLEPASYVQYANDHGGDSNRGQQLFADPKGIGCIKGYLVGGVGTTNIGPDLRGIGAKYSRSELIRSVLEPSNRVLIDFEMVIVVTTDGVVHQGMISNQTSEKIELITPESKTIKILADEIELKKSNLSPMPNGLADGMTLQNFADIIAYLESLKQ